MLTQEKKNEILKKLDKFLSIKKLGLLPDIEIAARTAIFITREFVGKTSGSREPLEVAKNAIRDYINPSHLPGRLSPAMIQAYVPKIAYFNLTELLSVLNIANPTQSAPGINVYPAINVSNMTTYILEAVQNNKVIPAPQDQTYGKTYLYNYGTAGGTGYNDPQEPSQIHPNGGQY